MPLVFLPDARRFFYWGELPPALPALGGGEPARVALVTPEGQREVDGRSLPLLETAAGLAVVLAAEQQALPASVAAWVLASKLALDLVSRERIVPTLSRIGGRVEARWAVALTTEDAAQVAALCRSLPLAAHAVPAPGGGPRDVYAADALLRAYLDAVADALVRSVRGGPPLRRGRSWVDRWQAALASPEPTFASEGFSERTLVDDLERWSEPALGARDRLRACFRLELPPADHDPFRLRFLLQSPDDPSLLLLASDVWQMRGKHLAKLGRAFRDPQESLLEALGRAARLYPPLERALAQAKPEGLELDPTDAWTFLSEGALLLGEAGFGVLVPAELTRAGQRRLRLRMRVGAPVKTAGVVASAAGLGMETLLALDWQAAIGDDPLTARELAALARTKAPLVRHRGAWVAIDPRELAEIQARVSGGPRPVTLREAVQAALAGEVEQEGITATVVPTGRFAALLEQVRAPADRPTPAPASLRATLRPYQERGLAWLDTLGKLGFGACLADDMGLGKTIQILAFLLQRLEQGKWDRPALLVAPTSVVGNWEREIERFAPRLKVVRHYGSDRARSAEALGAQTNALVVTSYGLLRRDRALLEPIEWSTVVLDEAQNIKNAASATAKAARGLRAAHRFALTGTPVENRVAELWSILEFGNPGLLGPLETFRRTFAIPIERYGNDEAAERLRKLVGPFLLRRSKSDPAIVADLPPKQEMKMVCTLTREQASLYQAVVDEEMRRIEATEGIERRGRVLALLLFLKQICNHPAQYLGERGPLPKRSGKLTRMTEMLEEILAAGDKALVFTQFREMGDRMVLHLEASLGCEVLFLHGGTPKRARDQMVRRFQEEAHGPRLFVLSVKAGGTGLNLTAASHVFHYDRWWNPAVEDQATDRAHRIGQRRAVQVHKLVCAGTVEEKVDQILAQKRKLASRIVGTGERWITELDDRSLRALFTLSSEAPIADETDEEGSPRRLAAGTEARA